MENNIVKQYEYLRDHMNPAVHDEFSVIISAYEELVWREKTDEEKWNKRLGSVSWTRRMSISEEGREIINYYFLELVEVSKIIVSILDDLQKQESTEFTILRLKALLLIEKGYIDEFFQPKRHLPKGFFIEMLTTYQKDINNSILIEKLENLKTTYSTMYDRWIEREKRLGRDRENVYW